ncbi:unnamed protein product [Pleuronectes platessa]|uniref:Uncharacterized protein n=1 Tax=Pleuronectes platessa TaxID=8262 RepID=A0A9N7TWX5_PLEPL|nr:unnamed protein product [Pleuronectes platessa]
MTEFLLYVSGNFKNKPQFRYCIGEVAPVKPILLGNGTGEHLASERRKHGDKRTFRAYGRRCSLTVHIAQARHTHSSSSPSHHHTGNSGRPGPRNTCTVRRSVVIEAKTCRIAERVIILKLTRPLRKLNSTDSG